MNNTAEVMDHEEVEVQAQALDIYNQAYICKVVDPASYENAGLLAKIIKDASKKIVDYFKPMKEAAQKAHKTICEREKEHLKPLADADALVRRAMSEFLQEQERIRREEERKVQLKADEEARKERERLEAQALKALDKGTDKGNARAEALLEQAQEVVAEPVFIAPVVDKTVRVGNTAITSKSDIEVIVTDIQVLCAAVAYGDVPSTVIKIANGQLKTFCKNMQVKSGQHGLHIKDVFGPAIR